MRPITPGGPTVTVRGPGRRVQVGGAGSSTRRAASASRGRTSGS